MTCINDRNIVFQGKGISIDVSVKKLENLLFDLQVLRDQWEGILQECRTVATAIDICATFSSNRKASSDDEENKFKRDTFLAIIDSVITAITTRFKAMKNINKTFSFLWEFQSIEDDDQLSRIAMEFVEQYKEDVTVELKDEIVHLKHIYSANFPPNISPLDLLNAINAQNLETIFSSGFFLGGPVHVSLHP